MWSTIRRNKIALPIAPSCLIKSDYPPKPPKSLKLFEWHGIPRRPAAALQKSGGWKGALQLEGGVRKAPSQSLLGGRSWVEGHSLEFKNLRRLGQVIDGPSILIESFVALAEWLLCQPCARFPSRVFVQKHVHVVRLRANEVSIAANACGPGVKARHILGGAPSVDFLDRILDLGVVACNRVS